MINEGQMLIQINNALKIAIDKIQINLNRSMNNSKVSDYKYKMY